MDAEAQKLALQEQIEELATAGISPRAAMI